MCKSVRQLDYLKNTNKLILFYLQVSERHTQLYLQLIIQGRILPPSQARPLPRNIFGFCISNGDFWCILGASFYSSDARFTHKKHRFGLEIGGQIHKLGVLSSRSSLKRRTSRVVDAIKLPETEILRKRLCVKLHMSVKLYFLKSSAFQK